MQTFLPYADFKRTAQVLDYRRLGKQRLEALTILKTLYGFHNAWKQHPIMKMWQGFENALKEYYNIIVSEWIHRGYKNNMLFASIGGPIVYPQWLGNEEFHLSHQSNLLRKDFNFYNKFFINVPTNLDYIWNV